jgi:hypothetical protein
VDGGERLPIRVRTPTACWRRVTLGLPGDWVGKPMRVVAEAGAHAEGDWFGFSNPRALDSGLVLLSNLSKLAALPVCVVSLLLFLLPGLPLAALLAVRGVIAPAQVVVVAVIFGCLAGYLTFWAYFLHAVFGRCFGGVLLVGGVMLSVYALRRGRPTRALVFSGEVATPLLLTALVALVYVALWQSVNLWMAFTMTPRLRFLEFVLMIDNELPYYLAERLYNGVDPRQVWAGWQSSDRPPLQSGLLLVQMPIGYLPTLHGGWSRVPSPAGGMSEFVLTNQSKSWSLIYGVALQCLWVPALWQLWQAAGLSRRKAGVALLFVALTGFALVNSVYTWPKMLAAALAVSAISLALFPRRPDDTASSLVSAGLWGLAAALAFLTHSGVAFTLVPFALLLLFRWYYPGFLRLAVAAGVFVAATVPWSFYQLLYDPPGNKLIREHLAGHMQNWDDGRLALLNIGDAYREAGFRKSAENKLANLLALVRASEHPDDEQYPWPPGGHPEPWPIDATSLRRSEFLCLIWAPGLLNVGWLVAARWVCGRPVPVDPTLGFTLPALALVSTVVWILLMFGPETTVIHQGSYATLLLIFAALAAWLTTLPGRLPYALLTAHGTLFVWTWLLTSPANAFGIVNPFATLSAIVCLLALCGFALRTARHDSTAVAEVLGKSRQPDHGKPQARDVAPNNLLWLAKRQWHRWLP